MKKYNITVNGVVYAVEVEEAGGVSQVVSAPAPALRAAVPAAPPALAPAPAAPPAPVAPAPAAPAPAAPSAGAFALECPMPGTIMDIRVTPGESVAVGQVLLILEAMKMENEIPAPQAGIVDTIQVAKGASVNAGDILITLK
jgi:biotin carboxyl carrier protein